MTSNIKKSSSMIKSCIGRTSVNFNIVQTSTIKSTFDMLYKFRRS